MLILHVPWEDDLPWSEETAIQDFTDRLQELPPHVLIPFERIKARRLSQNMDYEPVNSDKYDVASSFRSSDVPEDLQQIIQLALTLPKLPLNHDDLYDVDFGLSYDWDTQRIELPMSLQETTSLLFDKTRTHELA